MLHNVNTVWHLGVTFTASCYGNDWCWIPRLEVKSISRDRLTATLDQMWNNRGTSNLGRVASSMSCRVPAGKLHTYLFSRAPFLHFPVPIRIHSTTDPIIPPVISHIPSIHHLSSTHKPHKHGSSPSMGPRPQGP